jgi:hypothetical protein
MRPWRAPTAVSTQSPDEETTRSSATEDRLSTDQGVARATTTAIHPFRRSPGPPPSALAPPCVVRCLGRHTAPSETYFEGITKHGLQGVRDASELGWDISWQTPNMLNMLKKQMKNRMQEKNHK